MRIRSKVTSTGLFSQRVSHVKGILCVWILCTLCSGGAIPDLRLEEDRIWLETRESSIRDILTAFAHAGVSVKIGPGVEASVSGRAEGRPVDQVLKEILGPFDFVIYWNVIEGPEGRMKLLKELKVYRPGYAQSLETVRKPSGLLDVIRRKGLPDHVGDELLVGFKPGTTKAELQAALSRVGGTVAGLIKGTGIYRIRLRPNSDVPALVQQLKQDPVVAVTEPNYVYRPQAPNRSGDKVPGEVSTDQKAAPGVPPIAVLDTGLLGGSALGGLLAGSLDAVNPGRAISDTQGHGTQMALVASGSVAPEGAGEVAAQPILAVKAFDDAGNASSYSLIEALQFAGEEGARVMNLSWGSPTDSPLLANMITKAQEQGMVVVAAAGNEPTGAPVYPAAYPNVVAVAAATEDGSTWEKSNFGDFVTLAAPGEASLPIGYQGPPGQYAGTSIASAYTAGVINQYLAEHPDAGSEEVIQALQGVLTDKGEEGKDAAYGYGLLDEEALERLLGR